MLWKRSGFSALRPQHSRFLRASPPSSFSANPGHNSIYQQPLTLSNGQKQTIYALSTPPGKAGVAVIRISGPAVHTVRQRMLRPAGTVAQAPTPWRMERCQIRHPETQEILDDGLAVFFKGPKSFTTEDTLELHIHSGRAIISTVLAAVGRVESCRPAEPGEFTRRAFLGGRLDLTQVEGLKDLVNAETDGQRRLALMAARGASRNQYDILRNNTIHCLAMIEALIDFGEGEDIEEGVYERGRFLSDRKACHTHGVLTSQHTAREEVQALRAKIQGHLDDKRKGEILRTGIRLAIFGPPNAGKSSLLNFLAQRDAAIVTPIPGTTRDILELSLDINGLPIIVADTAGLRKTDQLVEKIGIDRAKKVVQTADATICVLSLPDALQVSDEGRAQLQIPTDIQSLINEKTFLLLNKSDLCSSSNGMCEALSSLSQRSWIASLNSLEGTVEFLNGLAQVLKQRYEVQSEYDSQMQDEAPLVTHARQRIHLESAVRHLDVFLETGAEDVVVGAEELRYASQEIGRISGLIDVEDVLDAVFRDFCIGK
ncbi:hypothetical protein HGRIS_009146 [Hohenbuehelia grisea]|uniref:TrmE-type G domain-containing protein n=1 Tax=Hohenbuehelia grisea TaxID=104357 RepID=A0ABR3J0B9_9AGAR